MYDPQEQALDFEIGSLWSKAKGALNKVTDVTIVKPSAAIGGAIGGKKGRAIGEKLGKVTALATKVGVGAGAAGVAAGVAPAIAPVGVPVATAMLAKKHFASSKKKAKAAINKAMLGGKAKAKPKAKASVHRSSAKPKSSTDNALAAKVAAMLVAKFSGPLGDISKAIKLADLQRTATYEHKKLMSDADFRRAVLGGIAKAAKEGNADCQRTIRVLVGR